MQVIAQSSTHAPRSASSAHCAALRFRAGEILRRVGEQHAAAAARNPVRPRSCFGRASRGRSRGSRRDRGRAASTSAVSGSRRALVVDHGDARTGKPELRPDAAVVVPGRLESVGNHTNARTEAQGHLDRGRIHAARPRGVRSRSRRTRQRRARPGRPTRPNDGGREVVRLEHDGPVPRGRGFRVRAPRTRRPTVRGCAVGTESGSGRSAAPERSMLMGRMLARLGNGGPPLLSR